MIPLMLPTAPASAAPMTAAELAMRVALLVDQWFGDEPGPDLEDATAFLVQRFNLSETHAQRLLNTAMEVLHVHYDPAAPHASLEWDDAITTMSDWLCVSGKRPLDRRMRLIHRALEEGAV